MAERNGGGFAWQEGYGAFSVSASQTGDVIRYIKNQAKHHAKRSFEQEFLEFLEKYGVAYDPAHVARIGVAFLRYLRVLLRPSGTLASGGI
jgi:hypothetical protein